MIPVTPRLSSYCDITFSTFPPTNLWLYYDCWYKWLERLRSNREAPGFDTHVVQYTFSRWPSSREQRMNTWIYTWLREVRHQERKREIERKLHHSHKGGFEKSEVDTSLPINLKKKQTQLTLTDCYDGFKKKNYCIITDLLTCHEDYSTLEHQEYNIFWPLKLTKEFTNSFFMWEWYKTKQ